MTPRFFAALSTIGVLALLAGGAREIEWRPHGAGRDCASDPAADWHTRGLRLCHRIPWGSVKDATIANSGVFRAPSV